MSLFRRGYGASPLHLLLHAVWALAVGWALLKLADVNPLLYLLAWFVGAIVLHDFVLLPVYGALDRVAGVSLVGKQLPGVRLPGAVNHVRVPTLLSGLLLLVYFPIITGRGEPVFARVSGDGYDTSYFERWLLFSLALFGASAILYGVRAALSARSGSRSPGSMS